MTCHGHGALSVSKNLVGYLCPLGDHYRKARLKMKDEEIHVTKKLNTSSKGPE